MKTLANINDNINIKFNKTMTTISVFTTDYYSIFYR